jgi:formylglycine-generating enzyme required for sulfatase activity
MACHDGVCVESPSCDGLAPNCGDSSNEWCCTSSTVPGGTFNRSDDAAYPATVSTFSLDRFEVTVGRFRKFVAAFLAGYRPKVGSGKHTHLNGGKGLSAGGSKYETGWDPSWEFATTPAQMGQSGLTLLPTTSSDWDKILNCSPYATWTNGGDDRPINCVTWYAMEAFCIWDGGFLPSEAEWNFAAAGGSQQLPYPWGPTPPSRSQAPLLAVFDCDYSTHYKDPVSCLGPVGSAASGYAQHGQADMAGNVFEWTADSYQANYDPICIDCYVSRTEDTRVTRGGAFSTTDPQQLKTGSRSWLQPWGRYDGYGARCARAPSPDAQ